MTEVNKETYILTIENNAENTIIKSLQKDNKELLKKDNPIYLDDVDIASNALKQAINPVAEAVDTPPQAADTSSQAADTSSPAPVAAPVTGEQQLLPPPPPVAAVVTPLVTGALPAPANNQTVNDPLKKVKLLLNGSKKKKKYYNGDLADLLQQIPLSKELTIKEKADLTHDITRTDMTNNTKISGIKKYLSEHAHFIDNKLQGGTHHTRKRTHKPRNTKSNTRKGHIYRTNHRRTHGKSSARGKKLTRRIVNR